MTTIAAMIETAPMLSRLDRRLTATGVSAYVVGGYVRDWLTGRDTQDVDLAVSADGFAVAGEVAAEMRGTFVPLDQSHRIARVVLIDNSRQWQLDFASYRDTIEDDLGRRDFTINAMAIPLGSLVAGEPSGLIDPFGGRRDLKAKRLRAVSDGVFRSDPSRLLRGLRLCAELELSIDEATRALIARDARLLGEVPGERVREELVRLFGTGRAGRWLHDMSILGLLSAIIPELDAAKGVTQPGAHHWDVLGHSLETVTGLEFLLRQGQWPHAVVDLAGIPWSEVIASYFQQEVTSGSNMAGVIKLAGLLHDIAKPRTRSVDDTGRVRFLGHPEEGAASTVAILRRLRFSQAETDVVATVVRNHLRPTQMAADGQPSHRAVYRFFRDTGDAALGTLFLSLADFLATQGPALIAGDWRQRLDTVNYVLAEHARQQQRTAPPRLLDGHDLMAAFQLRPGPVVGELLRAVNEAWATGDVSSKEEAMNLAARLLEEGGSMHSLTGEDKTT